MCVCYGNPKSILGSSGAAGSLFVLLCHLGGRSPHTSTIDWPGGFGLSALLWCALFSVY